MASKKEKERVKRHIKKIIESVSNFDEMLNRISAYVVKYYEPKKKE
jgi:hypothetical protein